MRFQTASELAALIRERRQQLGWSQQHLANRTGVGREWILQLEKGKQTVELGLVFRTLKALGVSLRFEGQDSTLRKGEIDLFEILGDRPEEDNR